MHINDIMKSSSIKVTSKAFRTALADLIDVNRISSTGKASLTKYILDPIQRSYPSSAFLYVFKDGMIVGQLFRVKGIFRFYYTSEYLAHYSNEIPTISLSIKPIDFDELLPAVFEDNLPEGINREILELTHKEADEFEILNLLNDNIGDLCFSKSIEKCNIVDKEAMGYLSSLTDILGENKEINLLKHFDIQIDYEEMFPDDIDMTKLKALKSEGISGFQYKKLVNVDFEKKIITQNENSHQYILKPYQKTKANPNSDHYFPHSALNEHLHLSFAKNALGLRVPYSAIVSTKDSEEYHYLIKRFDRKGVNKFAKATFSVFLGLRSENKYNTTSEKMFKRIAKELISPKERMELLKHYFYSIMIVHEDLHTKNLSLMFDQGKVLFAPLYDVCCTGIYETTKGYESYLPINGKRSNIRPNDFKALCKSMNINFKEFKIVATDMVNKYLNNMPHYFNEAEKLGDMHFSKKKYKTNRGDSKPRLIITEEVSFVSVLRAHHKKRVSDLYELGWIV
jgi:serine/threonine-protein kinase HipA